MAVELLLSIYSHSGSCARHICGAININQCLSPDKGSKFILSYGFCSILLMWLVKSYRIHFISHSSPIFEIHIWILLFCNICFLQYLSSIFAIFEVLWTESFEWKNPALGKNCVKCPKNTRPFTIKLYQFNLFLFVSNISCLIRFSVIQHISPPTEFFSFSTSL